MAETAHDPSTGKWYSGDDQSGWTEYESRDAFIQAQGNDRFMEYVVKHPQFAPQPNAVTETSAMMNQARQWAMPYIQKGIAALGNLPYAGPNPLLNPEEETARRSRVEGFAEGAAPYLNPIPGDLPTALGMAAGFAAAPLTAGASIPAAMARSAMIQGGARAAGSILEGGTIGSEAPKNPLAQAGLGALESTIPYAGRGIQQLSRQTKALAQSGKVVDDVIDWANDKLQPLIGKTLSKEFPKLGKELSVSPGRFGSIMRAAGDKFRGELDAIEKLSVTTGVTPAGAPITQTVGSIPMPIPSLGNQRVLLREIFDAVQRQGFKLKEGQVPQTNAEKLALLDRNELLGELSGFLSRNNLGFVDDLYKVARNNYARVAQIRDYIGSATDVSIGKPDAAELMLQYNTRISNLPESTGSPPKGLGAFGEAELSDLSRRLGRG